MKKKIAVIGLKGLPAFGGAATVGENIIEKLKHDFEFTVLSVSSHTSLKTGYINDVKQIVFKSFRRGIANTTVYYLKCLFHCLFNSYDLIYLHHSASGFITPMLRLRFKVVVTFHGVHSYIDPKFSKNQNRFFELCERLNVRFANEVVSVSIPDKEFVYKKYHKQIKYIPNGISVSSKVLNDSVSAPTENYILFAAGRIFKTKGLHILLKAAQKNNFKIKIIVAGDIEQVEDYKNEIMELKKGLNIDFVGLIKDKSKLQQLIRHADFFVFPSLNEAMSMMLLEVVAEKIPVIASDIPSNKAVFSDNELIFFESENVDSLASKLIFAVLNKTQLAKYAENAYKKLENNYTWGKIAEQYKTIFNEQIN